MTTWILFVTITNIHNPIQYAIPNIVSLAECNRVMQHVPKLHSRLTADFTFKCVEVYSK